eukprot:scaffold9761_cov118-Isochrysis_galbana.AAC.2
MVSTTSATTARPADRSIARERRTGLPPGGRPVELVLNPQSRDTNYNTNRGHPPYLYYVPKKTKLRERAEGNDGAPTAPAGAERGGNNSGQGLQASPR